MGEQKPDQCIFCEKELEEWEYEYFKENGERAIFADNVYTEMDICKDCATKLQGILKTTQKGDSGN